MVDWSDNFNRSIEIESNRKDVDCDGTKKLPKSTNGNYKKVGKFKRS